MAGNPEGGMPHIGEGHPYELGEPAGVEVALLEEPTHRRTAAPAVVTVRARHVVGSDHALTRRERRAGPDRHHFAHHLMPENLGSRRARGHDLCDVRATEATAPESQQQLALADRRTRPVFRGESASSSQHCCLHERITAMPQAARGRRARTQHPRATATLRDVDSVTRSSKTRNRRPSISSSRAK